MSDTRKGLASPVPTLLPRAGEPYTTISSGAHSPASYGTRTFLRVDLLLRRHTVRSCSRSGGSILSTAQTHRWPLIQLHLSMQPRRRTGVQEGQRAATCYVRSWVGGAFRNEKQVSEGSRILQYVPNLPRIPKKILQCKEGLVE